jgi:hypothetical protein
VRKTRLAAALLATMLAAPAWAHGQAASPAASAAGLAIPGIAHGQMAVFARNRPAILDLASQQNPTDLTMRRLQSFVNLQYFACVWGLAPGGVDDEDSPFNECSHAYLAATRALLAHLQAMPGDRSRADALAAKIEGEIARQDPWQVICQFSNGAYNTDEVIWPHWGEILARPIKNPGFALGALAIGFCASMILWRHRRELAAQPADEVEPPVA